MISSRFQFRTVLRYGVSLVGALAVVAVANVFLYTQHASAHTDRNYAIIFETSVGAYRGISGEVDYQNPDLNVGEFTNSTLWAVDDDTCAPDLAWVESGWSKRQSWGGQARHKFMYQVSPGCAFTIWPVNLGTPAIGPLYEYRLAYNSGNARWQMYLGGVYKAQVQTNWASADFLEAGGELKPKHNPGIDMGPSNSQQLQYRLTNGTWVQFNYDDGAHCDIDPPIQPYNLVYPGGAPSWIYVWGPAAGGYCGDGAP